MEEAEAISCKVRTGQSSLFLILFRWQGLAFSESYIPLLQSYWPWKRF